MIRQPEHDIDPLFVRRWSPRAMSGEPVRTEQLQRLFEAARWAPSSANNQPWRFLYGIAGAPSFPPLFDLLVEANRLWCQRAGALILVLSRTTLDNGKPVRTHSFDTGAAWMSLALQGAQMGLVVHGMAGFDFDRALTALKVPADHQAECMIAVGHPGRVEDLPEPFRAREAPSGRKTIAEFAFEGAWPTNKDE